MGKDMFLTYFQDNLRLHIENLLHKDWGLTDLSVSTEDKYLPGNFRGIMDLCVFNENDGERIVTIEIEHCSDHRQALRNIEKMKEWTHRSGNRNCSLLQIFNEDCYIHPNKIDDLILYGKENQYKGLGFYYDFTFYKITDRRQTNETAKKLVESMDFCTRLWMQMKNVKLVC